MGRQDIQALRERLAGEHSVSVPMHAEIKDALETAFPGISDRERLDATTLTGVDGILHLVGVLLPDWSISLIGTASEPDRHWTCTLRRSTADDDDEIIGHGQGPRLAPALLTALLGIAAVRAAR
ncbi:MAG: hypothetical protein AAF416_19325 [Pseudomonadota bacterium]